MTIPEADAVSTLLRYLAPGSTVPAEDAADAAAYLTGKVHNAVLADPVEVGEWVEAHAARVRAQHDEVERAQAKISEYENTTTWFTTCHGCAGHLDREYAADHRAAKAEAEVERLRAEVKRRDQDAARWQHVEPFLTRAREKGSLYLDVDDLLDAVQDAETGADDGTCGAVSEHGDVCVREEEHNGLCQSVGRRHASSPEKAGKPWRWYRSADVAANLPTTALGGDRG